MDKFRVCQRGKIGKGAYYFTVNGERVPLEVAAHITSIGHGLKDATVTDFDSRDLSGGRWEERHTVQLPKRHAEEMARYLRNREWR